MTHRSQLYVMPLIGSELAKPAITRANILALRPTLDRLELDRLHAAPRLTLATGGPARGLNRARRHPDPPGSITPARQAQSGPHAASYASLADVDRLHAARRFAILHAHALDAGLGSGAAATAAIAWLATHPARGHAQGRFWRGPGPLCTRRG